MKKLIFGLLIGATMLSFTAIKVLPTSLKITVLNSLGNIVEGADVTLYGNEDDYRNEENPVSETQKTDKKGRVTFKNLAPQIYFVYVEKGDMNNDGGGAQTDTLKIGKINKVNIVIE